MLVKLSGPALLGIRFSDIMEEEGEGECEIGNFPIPERLHSMLPHVPLRMVLLTVMYGPHGEQLRPVFLDKALRRQ